jgi:predicted O-methyltransferase YrrM
MGNAAHLDEREGAAPAKHRHPESWIDLDLTLVDRRFSRPFRKTYDYAGPFIDAEHRKLGEIPRDRMIDLGIEGWLLPDDALKLYELAYFSGGDILELGTFHGLSTSIMAKALVAAGGARSIETVDLDPQLTLKAQANLARLAGIDRVRFHTSDASAAVARFHAQGRRFAFVFVDHSHRYQHVLPTCRILWSVVEPGGFVLFHDFNDPRNDDPKNPEYGVYQAVADGLSRKHFEFWGVYGCAGLFRRTSSEPGKLDRAMLELRCAQARANAVTYGPGGSLPYRTLRRAVAALTPGATGEKLQNRVDRVRATGLYQWARRFYHALNRR